MVTLDDAMTSLVSDQPGRLLRDQLTFIISAGGVFSHPKSLVASLGRPSAQTLLHLRQPCPLASPGALANGRLPFVIEHRPSKVQLPRPGGAMMTSLFGPLHHIHLGTVESISPSHLPFRQSARSPRVSPSRCNRRQPFEIDFVPSVPSQSATHRRCPRHFAAGHRGTQA